MSSNITSATTVYFNWDDSDSDGSGCWEYSTSSDGSYTALDDDDTLIDTFTSNPETVYAYVSTNASYLLEINFVRLGKVPSQPAVVISNGHSCKFSLTANLTSSGEGVIYRLLGAYNANGNGGTVQGTDPTFKLTRSS